MTIELLQQGVRDALRAQHVGLNESARAAEQKVNSDTDALIAAAAGRSRIDLQRRLYRSLKQALAPFSPGFTGGGFGVLTGACFLFVRGIAKPGTTSM